MRRRDKKRLIGLGGSRPGYGNTRFATGFLLFFFGWGLGGLAPTMSVVRMIKRSPYKYFVRSTHYIEDYCLFLDLDRQNGYVPL